MSRLMKKVRSLAAVVAGMLVFGANAGTFLNDLATNANKVVSSEYATGGDVILKLDNYTWVHVFTNAAAGAVFRPSRALNARVFMVAGGGSGATGWAGYAGGGGGGGFVDDGHVAFLSDTDYAVTVGAGGARKTGNDRMPGQNGGDSSIVGDGISVAVAKGGGGGGGFHDRNSGSSDIKGRDGGSGGGGGGYGSGTVAGGQPLVSGQGNAGGAGSSSSGGGGGGAGGPGGDSESIHAGHGGTGRICNILGFDQYFAGGGGGGSDGKARAGLAGIGGGGEGGYAKRTHGEDAENGLGGGGGGASCKSDGHHSGSGGSGIVAVRYVVYDGEGPLLAAVSAQMTDTRVQQVSGLLAHVGAGATTANISVTYAPQGGGAVKTKEIAAGVAPDGATARMFSGLLTNLAPGTTYDYTLTAVNDLGKSSTSVGTFTTGPQKLAVSVSGGEEGVDYDHLTEVDGSDEVYIFKTVNKDMTFTVANEGFARVLVVGGGGGGYGMARSGNDGGGGGGAGGLIYRDCQHLTAGAYTVRVGKGGVKSSSWEPSGWRNGTGNGGNSVFACAAAGINFTAIGGGNGGGNVNSVAPGEGGSGGGGGYMLSGGLVALGAEDQGHMGGSSTIEGGCGGGGAGGAGGGAYVNASDSIRYAGAGGAPIALNITGELVDYAGGGGGGIASGIHGAGGGTSGGQGASKKESVSATAGKDGTGGGGGGANGGNGGGSDAAANGGSGTVIVRFTDYTKVADKPVYSTSYDNITPTSVDISIALTSLGSADAADIYAYYGYAEDACTNVAKIASAIDKSGVYTLSGLSPNRTYYFYVRLDNGTGAEGIVDSATFCITTPVAACNFTISSAGRVFTFFCDVSALGSGVNTARLYLGNGVQPVVVDERTLTEPGRVTFTRTFTPEECSSEWLVHIAIDNTDGEQTWTTVFADKSFTASDKTTYTWVSAVTEGYFNDEANWIPAETGFPVYGSTAKFSAGDSVTVKLRRNETMYDFDMRFDNLDLTVLGEGETLPKLTTTNPRGDYLWTANSTCVVDHVNFALNLGTGWPKFNNGTALILRNGAIFDFGGIGLEPYFGTKALVQVESGATLAFCNAFHGGRGCAVVLENGTMNCTGDFKAAVGSGSNVGPGAKVTFRGTNSVLNVTGSTYAEIADATFLFDLAGRPACIPAQLANKFPGDGGTYKFAITVPTNRKAALYKAPKGEFTFVSAGSINVSKIVFGTPAKDKDYFYFAESEAKDAVQYRTADEATASGKTMKYIRYHHESPLGTAIFLR